MTQAPSAELREHFLAQAEGCRRLGSPFTARLCEALPDLLDPESRFGRRVFAWKGHLRSEALGLRCAGGLHALRRSGAVPKLAAVYPPNEPDAAAFEAAIREALAQHDDFLHYWLDSPPQTNEVARSAVLLGGALHIAEATGLPLDWHEIGASMGLNLGFDRFRYELGSVVWGATDAPTLIRCEWRGTLPPLDAPLLVASRAGCDVNPLDPSRAADRERLLAYIWADQTERLARTQSAMDVAAAANWQVVKADAADWVEERLAGDGPAGTVRVLVHSIMWQYLPEPVRARIQGAAERAGERATRDAPFGWLRMEADAAPLTASVRLTLWPGGEEREIGRADFHGRFVEWS